MKATTIAGLLGLALLAGCRGAATTPAEEPGLSEEELALQGSWRAVYAERRGRELPPERVRKVRVVVEGDSLWLIEGTGDGELAVFELDPAQDPKAIDIIVQKGVDRGKRAPGIYHVEGDTLKLCWAEPDRSRPAQFTTEDGSAIEYLKLRRGP